MLSVGWLRIPLKSGLTPSVEHDPGTGGRADAAAWWPLSSCCQCGGALAISAPTLSVSVIVVKHNQANACG